MNQTQLNADLDAAAQNDPKLQGILDVHGYPAPRPREHGFSTLLRIIISQQLSTKVAAIIWSRVETLCGGSSKVTEQVILQMDATKLRECGLSWRKVEYAQALAERITSKALDCQALTRYTDEEVITALTKIKGYGVWSAEIYAMFALGRTDIFPAGDLALQIAIQRLLTLKEKPSEKYTREIAQRWSPHQTAVALLLWRLYGAATLD